MLFDALPPAIQDLVRDKVAGEVLHHPPLVLEWQRYCRFEQVKNRGTLSSAEIVQPEVVTSLGFGDGFAALKGQFVVRDATQPARRTRGTYPVDRSLEFYELNGPGYFVVSKRVRDLLLRVGGVADHMHADVFDLHSGVIGPTDWAIMDAPRAPVVDYARSRAAWGIHTFMHVDAKPGDPPTTVYVPNLHTHHVQVAIHDDPSMAEIVRDEYSRQHVFLSRRIRARLREAGVKGPDYVWVDGPWSLDTPPV